MIRKIHDLDALLALTSNTLKQCIDKQSDENLIEFHHTMDNLHRLMYEVDNQVYSLIKDKFYCEINRAKLNFLYIKDIYKNQKIVFCLYFMYKELPCLFFICRDGFFLDDFKKSQQYLDEEMFYLSVNELKTLVLENDEDWINLKEKINKSKSEILYIDDLFKEQYEKEFKEIFK